MPAGVRRILLATENIDPPQARDVDLFFLSQLSAIFAPHKKDLLRYENLVRSHAQSSVRTELLEFLSFSPIFPLHKPGPKDVARKLPTTTLDGGRGSNHQR
jgi:hypothetical protein